MAEILKYKYLPYKANYLTTGTYVKFWEDKEHFNQSSDRLRILETFIGL
jgi:hypothetical protein